MLKLVFVDMDGTFLNSAKKITSENLAAMDLAAQKSVQFVPCTAAISAFSRPMAKPPAPSPASSHGILEMAELMHVAMPLPKSVQPL